MEAIIITVLLTVLVPLVGSLISPLLNKILKEKIHFYAIAIAVITAALGITSFSIGLRMEEIEPWTFNWIKDLLNPGEFIQGGIFLDKFSLLMLMLVSVIAMLIVIFSHDYMHGDDALPRYYFWILFFIGSMLGLIVSDNLIQLFIFWEGVGLASYGLIGFWNRENENVKSGTKAFLVTRDGDMGLLAAIILIYFNVGTLSFSEFTSDFGNILGESKLIVLVGVLILVGIAGKSAQFPLQFWLPEAMAGPSTVSALIHAATMVKAGIYLGGRFLPYFLTAAPLYAEQLEVLFLIIAAVGVFTAFLAASIGMAAREFKKILAFSTISQLGYMLLAIGVAGLLHNGEDALFASIFHMTSHMFFKALLFLGAGAILHSVTTTKDIFEMGGLRKYMPKTTLLFSAGALSLAGIPPFAGFFSKETIFSKIIEYIEETSSVWGWIFLSLAVIAAIMTLFYTMRMIGVVFFGESGEHVKEAEKHGHLHDPSWFMMGPLLVLAIGSTIWGFFGGLIEHWFYHGDQTYGEWIGHIFRNGWGWLILAIIVIVGGIPGYLIYFRKVNNTFFANSFLQKFLYNRWYWNSLMLTVFVDGTTKVGDLLQYPEKALDHGTNSLASGVLATANAFEVLDRKIVDGAVNKIAYGFQWMGMKLRRFETGFISQYLWIGAFGFVILLIGVTLAIIL